MRVWFITGASRGFGALIAAEALKAGDAVVATARNPQDIAARFGEHPHLLPLRLDVTQEAEADAAAAAAVKRFGRIDILVNNAGYGLLAAVEEASDTELKRMFDTNVFGLLAVTRAVLPQMRRQRSGRVFNISSLGGYRSAVGWGTYCATKFAIEGLTEALASEVRPLGIFATVVEPGYFRTDFLDQQSMVRSVTQIDDYAETVGRLRSTVADINHAQPGDPQKLAEAMIVLANTETPPLRLPLGSDTVATIEQKNAGVAAELAAWRSLALSTDFPA